MTTYCVTIVTELRGNIKVEAEDIAEAERKALDMAGYADTEPENTRAVAVWEA